MVVPELVSEMEIPEPTLEQPQRATMDTIPAANRRNLNLTTVFLPEREFVRLEIGQDYKCTPA
jgi:hypothetical protein